MGLEDRSGRDEQDAGQDEHEHDGGARAGMTPERQERYDSVLAELEAGADEDGGDSKAKKGSGKGGARAATTRSAAARASDDRDAPDADDEDMELLPDDDGIVEGTEDEPKKPRRSAVPSPRDDDEDEETDVDAEEDEDEEDLADADDDDDEDPDEEEEEEPDTAAAKKAKLAWKQLARKEARDKAADAQRRAALERDKAAFIAEWQPQLKEVQSFKQLLARASRDPIGALEDFAAQVCKIDGQGWLAASKRLYLRSPDAEKDPRAAAEAAQVRREVEGSSAIRSLEEQIRSLTSKLEEKDQVEEAQRETRRYLKRAIAMADKATPLLTRMAKNRPTALRNELHLLAAELAEEAGRSVHPRKLIREWEKRETKRLAALGVKKVSKAEAGKPGAAKSKEGTGKQKPVQAGTNGEGKPRDRSALREDILRGMPDLVQPRGRTARA